MLFVIMGKSASGKDTVFKQILDLVEPIKMHTTRPKREGEKDGVEYYFVTEDEFKKLNLIESRCYDTVHGKWYYGTTQEECKKDGIIIATPEAYRNLKKIRKDVVPIYIETSDDVRLIRSIERERENKCPKYEELCRRFLADAEDFSEKILEELEILNRFNNDGNCISDVRQFIEKNLG